MSKEELNGMEDTERKKKYWVACGNCGIVFDLRKADWCKHAGKDKIGTKECPNCGNCICDKLNDGRKFRTALPSEEEYGFEIMLKEEHGGVPEVPD